MSLKCLHAGHAWSFCLFFIPPLFFMCLKMNFYLEKNFCTAWHSYISFISQSLFWNTD